MKSKTHRFVVVSFLLVMCFQFQQVGAQCTNRYLDTVFSSIDTFTNIAYTDSAGGAAKTELMDIYQPAGDTACLRHLIIWLHGGAFSMGTKNDGDMEFFCKRFAQRGYVCATINYRLASTVLALYDSIQIFKYMMEAISDEKAAIRYFYKSALLGNHWNIDTNAIFIGGSSAGAIASDFVATVNSLNELAPPFQTIVTGDGGLEGNSGNAGYSTKVIGVASLAGAVNSLNWIKTGVPPIVMCQGTADGTIPYDCDVALKQYLFGYPTIRFCGSGEMAPRLDSVGVSYSLLPFPGSGHVPWDTNQVIANRADSAVGAFFYSVNCVQAAGHCNNPTEIAAVTSDVQLDIYPNPANEQLHIRQNTNSPAEIRMFDCTGREVIEKTMNGKETTLSVKSLAKGIYLLRFEQGNAQNEPVTRKVIIE